MTHILADALVPIFAGLLLGYLAGRFRVMDNQSVRTMTAFVMSIAVPAALFLAIARTPRGVLREQLPTAILLAVVFVILYAISFAWTRFGVGMSPSESSVVALTLSFPNSAAVGLPLLASVFGPQSTVTVATSLAVGSITVSSITLAILEAGRDNKGLSPGHFALALIHSFKNPVLWAPLLGLLLSCAELKLPSFVDRSLAVMGTAAGGSALVLTGLVVSAQEFEIDRKTFAVVLLKNAVQPALALGIALLVHLSHEQIRYVTLISAMPCGFFGTVFGKSFGSNSNLASAGLIASYVIGVGTLAAWIVLVSRLG
jgi:malonate transporter